MVGFVFTRGINMDFMSETANSAASANSPGDGPAAGAEYSPEVLYQERQWVPWHWWLIALAAVTIGTGQLALNRNLWWFAVPFLVIAALVAWVLIHWSATVIRVERDTDGTRWLVAGSAQLPADVVSRSLAVPKSAKRNAMGPQLDPAAFLVTHSWVPHLVMLVLDDENDPTPYWLVSSKNPRALLEAFVPEQAQQASRPLAD